MWHFLLPNPEQTEQTKKLTPMNLSTTIVFAINPRNSGLWHLLPPCVLALALALAIALALALAHKFFTKPRTILSTKSKEVWDMALTPPFGCHYLSKATCLMRPHLFCVFLVASRINLLCYIIRHFLYYIQKVKPNRNIYIYIFTKSKEVWVTALTPLKLVFAYC